MSRNRLRIIIAIVVGVILILGVVTCFFVQDQTTILLLGILAILYVIYVAKLLSVLKKQRKEQQKVESPLSRRR